MRFGLVGTGFWARTTHAPALVSAEHATLVGVWGRDPARARALADDVNAVAYTDYDQMLADVDAVAFSVPPDVQADLATQAVRAGKHLMLEKPIALDADAGRVLETAVHQAGVASVVFFTQLFRPDIRDWIAACTSAGGPAEGGHALQLASAQREDGPFSTPWRLEHGGLWDVAPHPLSVLVQILGPVTSVAAHGRAAGTVHLVLEHQGGATSTVTASLDVPPGAGHSAIRVWGGAGQAPMPDSVTPVVDASRLAVTELIEAAGSSGGAKPTHPCDVTFGRSILDIQAEAARQLAERGDR